MPTYEFRCPDGHEFERFYRTISSAESVSACPQCGVPAERMMSATGFAFKGSGFYLTDYGKNAHRGEAPPSAGTSDAADGGGSDTADAKKGEGGSADTAKTAPESGDGAKKPDVKAAESKSPVKAEPKASDSKPAPAAPKPSSSE